MNLCFIVLFQQQIIQHKHNHFLTHFIITFLFAFKNPNVMENLHLKKKCLLIKKKNVLNIKHLNILGKIQFKYS